MSVFEELNSNNLVYYHVDAFTTNKYKGNPAAIIICNNNHDLSDEKKQLIASELNLPISVFITFNNDNNKELPLVQWFSSLHQIYLCGHGTLALAHIYFNIIDINCNEFIFNTVQVGHINVKKENNLYCITFPMNIAEIIDINEIPINIINAISNDKPIYIYRANNTLLFEYENDETIKNVIIDVNEIKKNKENRIIITSKYNFNKEFDFVSRVFHAGIEDQVCGSAHCTLGPFWSKKLNKNELMSLQTSHRSGILKLFINWNDNNVTLCGNAIIIANGKFYF